MPHVDLLPQVKIREDFRECIESRPGARAGVSTEARGPSFRARSIIVRVARLLYMHVLLVGSLVPIRNVPLLRNVSNSVDTEDCSAENGAI